MGVAPLNAQQLEARDAARRREQGSAINDLRRALEHLDNTLGGVHPARDLAIARVVAQARRVVDLGALEL